MAVWGCSMSLWNLTADWSKDNKSIIFRKSNKLLNIQETLLSGMIFLLFQKLHHMKPENAATVLSRCSVSTDES